MSRRLHFLLCLAFWGCLFSGSAGILAAQYYPNMVYGPKTVVSPGVTWQAASNANPAWRIHIIEIDMANPNVEVLPVFKIAGNVSGSANERTSAIALRSDAVAAINAGYFTTDGTRLTNSYTLIDGHFIGGSGTLMRPENNRSVIAFSGDGQRIAKRTKMSNTFVPADPSNWNRIVDAMAGRGHFVTSNGVLTNQDNEGTAESHYGSRHPRTAMGYSLNPYRVWLVTVDGRQTGISVGMTYTELGWLMADLGIQQSISLDGGGSTAAWIQGLGVVNVPSDGTERAVVSAWVAVPATTMDNAASGVTVEGPRWSTETSHPEQYHLDHFVGSSSDALGAVTWRPKLARNGYYKVYARWASDPGRSTLAPYRVEHAFGTSTYSVNQRVNGGHWQLLGTVPFRAGDQGAVRLVTSPGGTVSADAVRFVFVRGADSLFWAPTEWRVIAHDDFATQSGISFDPVVRNPPDSISANSRWQRAFNYTTLSGPTIPTPPGGNGLALRTAANNSSPAVAQVVSQTFDAGGDNVAVEALLLGYLSGSNTGGSTTWGGIGLRMSDSLQDGYFVQHRVDDSSSFGSYLNFYRIAQGGATLLGRYYYRVGTGGLTQGMIGDSRPIQSPQAAATNRWVRVRLEAIDDTVALFVGDSKAPVTVFTDWEPIRGGKAMLYHEDPFGSSLTVPADSSGTFFEYFRVEAPVEPLPEGWAPTVEALEQRPQGGVIVRFGVFPDGEYVVEASSDLVEWHALPGTFATDAEGSIIVEDTAAGDRRFWRMRRASPAP
jgi:hypothetical protein